MDPNQESDPFQIGSTVEIRQKSSWFEATITETPYKKNQEIYRVKIYKNTKTEVNIVCISNMRPLSPSELHINGVFGIYQQVEAYYEGGWVPGVVADKNVECYGWNCCYRIVFPGLRKEDFFRADMMRKRMEWVVGKWVNIEDFDECLSTQGVQRVMFLEGTKVEVNHDTKYGASWFVGNILKIIGKTYFLVEYENINLDNGFCKSRVKEIVDLQHIRPCPPVSEAINFHLLEEVEVLHKGGWILGVVSVFLPKCRYNVKLSRDNKEDTMAFHHTLLRSRLVWTDGHWEHISKGNKAVESLQKCGAQLFQLCKKMDRDKKYRDKSSNTHNNNNKGTSRDNNNFSSSVKQLIPAEDCLVFPQEEFSIPSAKSVKNSSGNNLVSLSVKRSNLIKDCHVLPRKECSIPSAKSIKNSVIQDPFPGTSEFKRLTQDFPLMEEVIINGHNDNIPCGSQSNLTSTVPSLLEKNNALSSLLSKNAIEIEVPKANESSLSSMVSITVQNDFTPHESSSQSNGDLGDLDKLVQSMVASCAKEYQSCVYQHVHRVGESENIAPVCNERALDKPSSVKNNIKESETPLCDCSLMDCSKMIELPFTMNKKTELMKLIESAEEVLSRFPQEPHYQPMLKLSKGLWEGMAFGLNIAFASLVTSVKKLTLFGSEQEYKEKLNGLIFLENYGFDVQPVRDCLEKLLEIRSRLRESEDKKNSTGAKLEELEVKKLRISLLLPGTEESIGKLEENLTRNQERKTTMILEYKKNEHEIVNLENAMRVAEEEISCAKRQFDASLTAPW